MEEQRIFASFINVLPFEIRSLKIGHTEQRRAQRFYIVAIVRFARFLKMFITKVISNTYTPPLSLFVPSAPP